MFQRCVETTLHISSQSQNPSRVAVESDPFLHKSLMSHHDLKIQNYFLVGGFSPVEKYESNWESSPNRDENEKYLKPPASILIPESRFEKKKKNSITTTSFQPSDVQYRRLPSCRRSRKASPQYRPKRSHQPVRRSTAATRRCYPRNWKQELLRERRSSFDVCLFLKIEIDQLFELWFLSYADLQICAEKVSLSTTKR